MEFEIRKVCVVGAGQMGSGIGQVCAQAGLEVALCDTSQPALDRALESIAWSVGKLAEKGRLQEDPEQVMGRIVTSQELKPAAEAQLVIEAVFEDQAVKTRVLEELGGIAPRESLVATNTSAIPISELAAALPSPERFVGLHFFNPVPMMQAVEVVRGILTSDETFRRGAEFVRAIGKTPILVRRDVAGFVINRINYPAIMEAMRLVEQGVVAVQDVDQGLRLASGRRMGIFETSDLVGLDVTYGALMAMHRETGEDRWFPPFILRRKVKAGHLGRKTGIGWYRYDQEGRRLGPAELFGGEDE